MLGSVVTAASARRAATPSRTSRLASVVTYPAPQLVAKRTDLLEGDVVLDARSRKCAVRFHKRGQLSLVKPRSGDAHDYALPQGGKLTVVGRVEGGWSPVAPQAKTTRTHKPAKAVEAKASKPRTTKAQPKATPASQAEAILAIADMLDAASQALRTVSTLV